jgi:hypothetical protein
MPIGRELRESIEVATDLQQQPLLDAIGTDFEWLVATLAPWSMAIVAAGGFPTSVEQISPAWGRLDD